MSASRLQPDGPSAAADPPPSPLTILVAEDDDGHAELIRLQFKRAGLTLPMLRFADGQEVLDFLFRRGAGPHRQSGRSYLVLLDIRMPKVDGMTVLRAIKSQPELMKLPVIMLTTTDDPKAVDECYDAGCSLFMSKPTDAGTFFEALRRLGLLLQMVATPRINGLLEAG